MSTMHANPFANPKMLTLAELLELVRADTDLPAWRRSSVASSIRMTGRWFGLELSAFPANRAFLRKRFQALSPGATGASKKRLQNARHIQGSLFSIAVPIDSSRILATSEARISGNTSPPVPLASATAA